MWKKALLILSIGLLGIVALLFGFMKFKNWNSNDLGLAVLTLIKNVQGRSVALDAIADLDVLPVNHQAWTDLLEKHVDQKGMVNYTGFIMDSSELIQYLDLLSSNPPGKSWSKAEQLAYWINAYNAFTVKLIIDYYPLESIKEIAGGLPMLDSPWDIKFFRIGGIPFDLNTIEHQILRAKFEEPRIHFAINCASISCPKLRTEAYSAQQLEQQLEEQTLDFLNDPERNLISANETKLSRIFDWFQRDFVKQSDIPTFIQQYNVSINKEQKIQFLDYDWALNED